MRPSPETDAITVEDWDDANKEADALALLARRLEGQRDDLLEALERAAENMKRAAEFHGCSNCREGEKLARAAIRKVRGEGKA